MLASADSYPERPVAPEQATRRKSGARELRKAEGDKSHWDLFAERTNNDVVLQLDVGWAGAAGVDPVALIRKYPGRTKTNHCKPHGGAKQKTPHEGAFLCLVVMGTIEQASYLFDY